MNLIRKRINNVMPEVRRLLLSLVLAQLTVVGAIVGVARCAFHLAVFASQQTVLKPDPIPYVRRLHRYGTGFIDCLRILNTAERFYHHMAPNTFDTIMNLKMSFSCLIVEQRY